MDNSEDTLTNEYKSDVNLSSDYSLAYNVLMQIFPYLDHKDLSSCSEVCNMWQSVVGEAPIWSTHMLRCCQNHLDEKLVNKRVVFFEKVKLIEVLNELTDDKVDIFATAVNLEELVLFNCYFNFNKQLKSIFKTLNVLKIYQSIIEDEDEEEYPYTLNFFENLSNLSELSITTKYSIPLSHFEALKQLKHLYLDADFKKGFFTTDMAILKNLKSFGIGFTFYHGGDRPLKKVRKLLREYMEQFAALLEHMPNLNKLQLFGLELNLDDEILRTVAKLPQLDTLELGIIDPWSPDRYDEPLQKCSNIKKLSIKSILLHGQHVKIDTLAYWNSAVFATVIQLPCTLQEFTWIFHRNYMEESEELCALYAGLWKNNVTALYSNTSKIKGTRICTFSLENIEEMLSKQLSRTKVRVLSDEFSEQCEFCPERPIETAWGCMTHKFSRQDPFKAWPVKPYPYYT